MNKVAAVVILYHPEKSVLDNIYSYLPSIDQLYIIDNTEGKDNFFLSHFYSMADTMILHKGDNIGIAKGLNLALDQARKDNYDWLMTMDQDSFFESDQLDKYLKDFNKVDHFDKALFSPLHNAKFVVNDSNVCWSKQLFVMTSANIVDVKKVLGIGGYDENLFIDEVDHELGLRLNQKGFGILRNNSVYVNHSLGTSFNENSYIKVYPPIRIYYMIRNYLYLREKYGRIFPDFFHKRHWYLLKFFMLQLVFNGKPLQSIKMFFRGLTDYRKKRFGKIDE